MSCQKRGKYIVPIKNSRQAIVFRSEERGNETSNNFFFYKQGIKNIGPFQTLFSLVISKVMLESIQIIAGKKENN